jgi:hypothetical protein
MIDRRQLTTPGHAGRLVRFLTDDSGAARHDRLFLIAGGGIVCALAVFMWASDALDETADAAGTVSSASAALKTVSSAPLRAPEPSPSEGAEGSESRVYIAADYSQFVFDGEDREALLLEDELARIREAEVVAAPGEAVQAVAEDGGGS